MNHALNQQLFDALRRNEATTLERTAALELQTQAAEIERLRAALAEIREKYLSGGSRHELTTSLAGTLAYMAEVALTPNR